MCNQLFDKVALDPTGTIPAEKFKCVKQYFLNLALLAQGGLPGESRLAFAHAAVGNPSLGVPILYLVLAGKRV